MNFDQSQTDFYSAAHILAFEIAIIITTNKFRWLFLRFLKDPWILTLFIIQIGHGLSFQVA